MFPPDARAFQACEGRTPHKMEWRLPGDMRREIYFAETRISDLIRQHDVQALEYNTWVFFRIVRVTYASFVFPSSISLSL